MCTYSITYVVSAWFAGIIELVCTVTQSIAPSAVANIVRMSCRPSYAVKWASLPLHVVFITCLNIRGFETDKIYNSPEVQTDQEKKRFLFWSNNKITTKMYKTNPPSNKNTIKKQETTTTNNKPLQQTQH